MKDTLIMFGITEYEGPSLFRQQSNSKVQTFLGKLYNEISKSEIKWYIVTVWGIKSGTRFFGSPISRLTKATVHLLFLKWQNWWLFFWVNNLENGSTILERGRLLCRLIHWDWKDIQEQQDTDLWPFEMFSDIFYENKNSLN